MKVEDWSKYAPEFYPQEFACKCGCGRHDMDQSFMDWLHDLRLVVAQPMVISSGYRCPEHNEIVSSTGRAGPHTTGKAADVFISRKNAHRLLEKAFRCGVKGVGVNQKGDGRFVHLDMITEGPRPTVWSY